MDNMERYDITPDLHTFVTLVNGYCWANNFDRAYVAWQPCVAVRSSAQTTPPYRFDVISMLRDINVPLHTVLYPQLGKKLARRDHQSRRAVLRVRCPAMLPPFRALADTACVSWVWATTASAAALAFGSRATSR